ncbi:MAG: thioredoxin family protein [Longimicrobiales bacterium]|nr:thioredoxin family protein [Longimicrobiales bacterium]
MVRTPSTMVPLGTEAPRFALPDTSGQIVRRDDFQGADAFLVIFMCNHCPYVKHLKEAIADYAWEYQEEGLAVVAISSNDVASHPEDAPAEMKEDAERYGYPFPYLFDETQEVAKAYGAACTPDFFLYDEDFRLAYRGQFDSSRPGNDVPVTGADLREATEAVLAGDDPPGDQVPSQGCNIKWKEGNAPDWFG